MQARENAIFFMNSAFKENIMLIFWENLIIKFIVFNSEPRLNI